MEKFILELYLAPLLIIFIIICISTLYILSLRKIIITLKNELEKKSARTESYEVKDLLRDLLAGSTLIQVKRVDPAEVFLRSPRGDQ